MIGSSSKRWISAMLAGALAVGGALPFYAAGAVAPIGVKQAVALDEVDWSDPADPIHVVDGVLDLTDSGLKSIEKSMFEGRDDIVEVIFPEGLGSIYERAFSGCTSLKSAVLPDGLRTIGINAFINCSSLEYAYVPASVGSFSTGVFKNCSSLRKVDFYAHPSALPVETFSGCSSLESFVVPAGVRSIGYNVFDGCSSLESVTLPDGITTIGANAFLYCGKLSSINIPESVRSIASNAFLYCSKLSSINIPESVTSIGANAFASSGLRYYDQVEGLTPDQLDALAVASGNVNNPTAAGAAFPQLVSRVSSLRLVTPGSELVAQAEDETDGAAASPASYTAIKVFDAEITGAYDADEAPKASYIKYADGVESVFTTDDETMNPQIAAEEIAENIQHQPGEGLAAGSYGKEFAKKLIAAGADTTEVFADADGYVDLPGQGYYLIVKTDALEGEDTAATSPIFAALGSGKNTIYLKTAIPSLTKEVLEDSTGEWASEADHTLNDVADYRLVGTVAANVDAYDTYGLTFTDTFSADALTITGDIVVTVDGIDVSDQVSIDTDTPGTIFVNIEDLKALNDEGELIPITADTEVLVMYSAYQSAGVASPEGVQNEAFLEYSNNPMVEDSKGSTPKVETRDYSYVVQIHKTDNGTGEDLEGVEFSVKTSEGKYLAIEDGKLVESDTYYGWLTDENGMITIDGADADDYIVVEEQELPGYAKLDDELSVSMDASDRLHPSASVSATTDLVAGEDSDDAAAYINVKNVKEIGLPSTGEMGLGLAVLIAIGLGAYAITRRNRKDEAEVMHV